jgi:hypothetical protein
MDHGAWEEFQYRIFSIYRRSGCQGIKGRGKSSHGGGGR